MILASQYSLLDCYLKEAKRWLLLSFYKKEKEIIYPIFYNTNILRIDLFRLFKIIYLDLKK